MLLGTANYSLLHVECACRNTVVPVSQLVVLLSHNLWVRFVHPNTPKRHRKGGEMEGRKEGRRKKGEDTGEQTGRKERKTL